VTSDLRAEVEIWPFRACVMHPVIIIGTVRSLWTWLWGRYHVPHISQRDGMANDGLCGAAIWLCFCALF